jgi:hypothetical protein
MLLYVPLQMRAAWRAEMSAGAAATMALPMKAEMMVEASILMVELELEGLGELELEELLGRKMLI